MPPKTHLRAVLANRSADLNRSPGDPAAVERRDRAARDYYAEALAEHITATLAKAPPLTDEQRARLARIIAPHLVGAT